MVPDSQCAMETSTRAQLTLYTLTTKCRYELLHGGIFTSLRLSDYDSFLQQLFSASFVVACAFLHFLAAFFLAFLFLQQSEVVFLSVAFSALTCEVAPVVASTCFSQHSVCAFFLGQLAHLPCSHCAEAATTMNAAIRVIIVFFIRY